MNQHERFVDTGFWFALANRDDAFHGRAVSIAHRSSGRLVTTEAVVIEVGNALSRLRWRTVGIRFVASIVSDPALTIVSTTPDLIGRAIALYSSHRDKEWGLTDCISFVVMRERGLHEALAADHHFVQAGFRALLLEP